MRDENIANELRVVDNRPARSSEVEAHDIAVLSHRRRHEAEERAAEPQQELARVAISRTGRIARRGDRCGGHTRNNARTGAPVQGTRWTTAQKRTDAVPKRLRAYCLFRRRLLGGIRAVSGEGSPLVLCNA